MSDPPAGKKLMNASFTHAAAGLRSGPRLSAPDGFSRGANGQPWPLVHERGACQPSRRDVPGNRGLF